jgi:hypothetical protein
MLSRAFDLLKMCYIAQPVYTLNRSWLIAALSFDFSNLKVFCSVSIFVMYLILKLNVYHFGFQNVSKS